MVTFFKDEYDTKYAHLDASDFTKEALKQLTDNNFTEIGKLNVIVYFKDTSKEEKDWNNIK